MHKINYVEYPENTWIRIRQIGALTKALSDEECVIPIGTVSDAGSLFSAEKTRSQQKNPPQTA